MHTAKLSPPLRGYIALHAVVFPPLLLWAWRSAPPTSAPVMAFLLASAAVAGAWRFELTVVRGRQSLVLAVVCLALVLQGVAAAALTSALGALVTHLFRPEGAWWRLRYLHEPLYRHVFNVSHCGAVATIAGKLALAAQPAPLSGGLDTAATLLLFASVYFLLNTWGVATAIALDQQRRAAAVWRDHFFWIAPEYLFSGGVAGLVAILYQQMGAAAMVLLPCLFLVFRAQRAYVETLARERKLHEQEEEVNRRKDEFLAMLAHELRNPLAAIQNTLGVMRAQDEQPPARLEVLERHTASLSRLVDDLLDASRITRGTISLRLGPVDLVRVVRDAVETVGPSLESRSHHLRVQLPDAPVVVHGDETRLEQVVTNLLVNAARYTPPGGRIEVSISIRTGKEPGAGERAALVRVADDGVGISPEQLARIFEPFTQLHRTNPQSQAGLGIGLSLVKQLVELHGGKVEAYSEGPGRGSEFWVILPLSEETGAEAAGIQVGRYAGIQGAGSDTRHPTPYARVLIVDDNEDAGESLGELLETWGYAVRVVADGVSGLEAARALRPDVALLDLGLPGMDGCELARRIRDEELHGAAAAATGSRILLIALTGFGQAEDRRRTAEAGFDHHLVKPVQLDALRRLLADLRAPVESE